jgi:hypothetical protein
VGYRVVFTIFLPSGDRYTRTLYRRDKRQAEDLLGLATRMEALPRQHALTTDLAVTFQHEDLLRPEDLTRLFPMRRQLAFDRRPLLASYTDLCHRQCTSDRVIAINLGWAEKLLDTLGDLSAISQEAIEAWTANARDHFPHHTRADGKALGKWSYGACFLLIRPQNLRAHISRIGVHRVACTGLRGRLDCFGRRCSAKDSPEQRWHAFTSANQPKSSHSQLEIALGAWAGEGN